MTDDIRIDRKHTQDAVQVGMLGQTLGASEQICSANDHAWIWLRKYADCAHGHKLHAEVERTLVALDDIQKTAATLKRQCRKFLKENPQ